MLVLGMLLDTTGAGLAVSGLSGKNASDRPVPTPTPDRRRRRPRRSGHRLRHLARGERRRRHRAGRGLNTQPARQVEAGANNSSLPFTGFAAIPVLLGGIALLSAGLVLRRRTGDER